LESTYSATNARAAFFIIYNLYSHAQNAVGVEFWPFIYFDPKFAHVISLCGHNIILRFPGTALYK